MGQRGSAPPLAPGSLGDLGWDLGWAARRMPVDPLTYL